MGCKLSGWKSFLFEWEYGMKGEESWFFIVVLVNLICEGEEMVFILDFFVEREGGCNWKRLNEVGMLVWCKYGYILVICVSFVMFGDFVRFFLRFWVWGFSWWGGL